VVNPCLAVVLRELQERVLDLMDKPFQPGNLLAIEERAELSGAVAELLSVAAKLLKVHTQDRPSNLAELRKTLSALPEGLPEKPRRMLEAILGVV
jgi:hypothetical protein